MHTKADHSEKKSYLTPSIEIVKLDKEISLAMESDAPAGPGEGKMEPPKHINNDPYKSYLG